MVYILAYIPLIVVSTIASVAPERELFHTATVGLSLVTGVLWMYLLVAFRRLLHVRLTYTRADGFIYTSIVLTAISTAMMPFIDLTFSSFDSLTIAYLVVAVAHGIVSILLGKRLLAVEIYYRGLRLFAWMLIITGIFLCTVILMVVGVPFGLIADIALMMMFFRAAREIRELRTQND